MSNYLEIIKTAIFIFPIIAFLFTLPYMMHQYHKYGSVYALRSIIIYSFILYLIVAYFLIILPLPSIEEVKNLTTDRWQLQPFSFVIDILNKTNFQINDFTTYINLIKSAPFYQAFFNILLCLPFGVYLCYYFKFNLKETIILSFLLSLFFEVTQLTGLYFIYPRGYRLFDVDDLILNTIGGMIGYYIGRIASKILPTREEIDEKAFALGSKVTFSKRLMSFWCDFAIFHIIFYFSLIIIPSSLKNNGLNILYYSQMFIYFCIIPILHNHQTIAQNYFHLKFWRLDNTKEVGKKQIILYQLYFYFIYFGLIRLVFLIISFLSHLNFINTSILNLSLLLLILIYVIFIIVTLIKKIRGKPLLYEKLSGITLKSTIICPQKSEI